MFKSYHPSLPPANSGRVMDAKIRFEARTGRKPILDNIMEKIEKLEPDHAHLLEKEKPIIAELITKLKNREQQERQEPSLSEFSLPSMSVLSDSMPDSSNSTDDLEPQHSVSKADISKKPSALKSSFEKLLTSEDETKEKFREFISTKGASEDLNFWDACFECERKAHGYASLAKKIINQLMKEIVETHGHPEKSHMDLALSSAVTAVRYELLMHKEETKQTARDIVEEFVRDESPQRVNITTELRRKLIDAVDNLENFSESELVKILVRAQNEIKDLMERKFYDEFSATHRT
jgi:hypothetical protein